MHYISYTYGAKTLAFYLVPQVGFVSRVYFAVFCRGWRLGAGSLSRATAASENVRVIARNILLTLVAASKPVVVVAGKAISSLSLNHSASGPCSVELLTVGTFTVAVFQKGPRDSHHSTLYVSLVGV